MVEHDYSNPDPPPAEPVIQVQETPAKKKVLEKDSAQDQKDYRWPLVSTRKKSYMTTEIASEMTFKNESEKPTAFKDNRQQILGYSDNKIMESSAGPLGEPHIHESSFTFEECVETDQMNLNEANLEIDCGTYFGRTSSKIDIPYFDHTLDNGNYNRDAVYLGLEAIDGELEAEFPILPFGEKNDFNIGDGCDFMDLEGYMGENEENKRRNSSNSLIGGY